MSITLADVLFREVLMRKQPITVARWAGARYRLLVMLTAAAVGAGVLATHPARARNAQKKLSLSAFWVDQTGHRSETGTLDIAIERWSTQEEVDHLQAVLESKGNEALLRALQRIKPRTGYVRTPTSVAWDLYYAREVATKDGGRKILIATDRPVSYWEAFNRPRSIQYGFSLVEIHLDKDGHGSGKLVPAARITFDKNTRTIEIENYDNLPVRLSDVRVFAPSSKKAN
jgi:hypothetical protein